MSAPMITLSGRIQALTLKDEKFGVHIPASDSEIEDFFEHIHFIEPNLDRKHLTKEVLKDAPALKNFMDVHCHISQYAFQIKKCKDESCYYCIGKPVQMSAEVFESLHFLPLPRLDSTKKHYKPFGVKRYQSVIDLLKLRMKILRLKEIIVTSSATLEYGRLLTVSSI